MRKKTCFENGSGCVLYHLENNIFYIKCQMYSSSMSAAVKLFAGNNPYSGKMLCLGTLSKNEFTYSLEKEYSLSYLESENINPKQDLYFEAVSDGGEKIRTANKEKDPALLRGENLLTSIVASPNPEIAQRLMDNIGKRIKNYSESNDIPDKNYKWYEITTADEDFNLSSVRHVIYTPQFMSLYCQSHNWYFGYGKADGIYALGIFAPDDRYNPMVNVSDCLKKIKTDKNTFNYIGIELTEDGQYFYRCE